LGDFLRVSLSAMGVQKGRGEKRGGRDTEKQKERKKQGEQENVATWALS